MAENPVDLLPVLAASADRYAAALAGADAETIRRRPAPGKWSAAGVVAHLAEAEMSIGVRLRQMLTLDEPTLTPYDPDAWAALGDYEGRPVHTSLALWRLLRADNVALLGRLSPEQWQRGCIHPERGRMVVADWASLLVWHDNTHLAQLERALATP